MSALARYFLAQGAKVSGSDMDESAILTELSTEGVEIFNGHKAENVPLELDLLVYSEAIPTDNPERQMAREKEIKEQSYFQALGEAARAFRVIAVAGTHGKSTTTAMLGLALPEATVFVGTKIFEWGGKNFHTGNSDLLVAEACEYRNSFLNFKPYIAVITSLEPEHLDFFGTSENYFAAFKKFIAPAEFLVADFGDPAIAAIAADFPRIKIDSRDFIAAVPPLSVPGEHNIANSSKVLGVFAALGRDQEKAKKALMEFRGSWRRLEQVASNVYDDYGHHPTEIRTTLKALREKYPQKKIFCVFQPHQYSRTRFFLDDFGKSFDDADEVLIPNIYRVRDSEEDVRSVSAEDLVEKIRAHGVRARFTENFARTVAILRTEVGSEDILLTIGAGPIDEVAKLFCQKKEG